VRVRSTARAIAWCATVLWVASATSLASAAEGRQTLSLDQGWRFHLGDVTEGEKPQTADADWRPLDVPHDFSIEGPPGADPATMEGPFDRKSPGGSGSGSLNGGIAWYRKTFTLPEDAKGKRVFVRFDGVYMDSDVWLNGTHLGKHPYGYTGFQYDLTPQMKPGGNVLAVRVHVQQPCSRWYSGAGIYRHVWLTITDPVHVAQWGTYVTTPEVSDAAAQVRVRTRVQNEGEAGVKAMLTTGIVDAGGKKIAEHQAAEQIAADGEDLSFVEVRIVDKDGNLCPNADNQITFGLEGPGTIAGVDNGDPTNHEPFKVAKHKAFHGLCLAVIQAARTPGEIRLSATAQGLQSEPVAIAVSPAAER